MEVLNLIDTSLEEAASKAATALSEGRIILYPTDTVYGLGVDAENPEALAALNALKGREEGKTMLIMLPSIEAIEQYAAVSDVARALAKQFLPGPLTLILPVTADLPDAVVLNGTMGVRIPDDPFCRALSRAFPGPITSTSANKAGLSTLPSIEEILEQLKDTLGIALAVDDGGREGGIPSTIVSCTGPEPTVLREGRISREAIDAVLESEY